jgi:anhydro-N-acetylmuramic acid kinase
MVYKVLGVMSGSSLDGLDLAFAEFQEVSGKWNFVIKAAACYPYPVNWTEQLRNATELSAKDYLLLHTAYGHYIGSCVNRFIEEQGLAYQVQLIASHGHTVFHLPEQKMTAQLGDGATIAATTGIHTVTELRAMDVALGGQGAPIVPIGEQLLFHSYGLLLNLGGIANITLQFTPSPIAWDICPANRVLNLLAETAGRSFDENGSLARSGKADQALLSELNDLEYYTKPAPKSLANEFGTGEVYPMIRNKGLTPQDALATYTLHIAEQIKQAIQHHVPDPSQLAHTQLLITGGGAHNTFLVESIQAQLDEWGIKVSVPDPLVVDFKEALIMALIGVLRWREEDNVLSSVTGATRSSIGGAMWLGK